jgi:REP element-mobilizing transposase RayT
MRYNFGPTHSPGFKPWAFKKRCIFRIGYKMVKTIKSIFSKYITHGLNRGLKECKESITVLTVLKLTNMPHSYNKIWIHAIWSTKGRIPLISSSIEQKVYPFISEQLREKGCPARLINVMPDHIHCLFLLNSQKSISELIKQIKGSSSHWINQNNLISEKFAWQTGFASYSVSESVVEKVYQYIKNITIKRKAFSRNITSF